MTSSSLLSFTESNSGDDEKSTSVTSSARKSLQQARRRHRNQRRSTGIEKSDVSDTSSSRDYRVMTRCHRDDDDVEHERLVKRLTERLKRGRQQPLTPTREDREDKVSLVELMSNLPDIQRCKKSEDQFSFQSSISTPLRPLVASLSINNNNKNQMDSNNGRVVEDQQASKSQAHCGSDQAFYFICGISVLLFFCSLILRAVQRSEDNS